MLWALGWACLLAVGLTAALFAINVRLSAKHERAIRENGVSVLGWITHARRDLLDPGETDRPAQALVTFDPAVTDPAEFLSGMAAKARRVRERGGSDAVEEEVFKIVTAERYQPYRRYLLPKEFTGGPAVFAVFVWVERRLLPGGILTRPFVRLRALPNDPDSRVLMEPYLEVDS